MTISFISAASANADSVAMPSHQQWDLLVAVVHRHASTTPPIVPSGWRVAQVASGGSNVLIVAIQTASSSSEVSGTWTNADQIGVAVYRSDSYLLSLTNGLQQTGVAGSGDNITHPKMNVPSPPTNKWLLAAFAHRSIDTDIEVGPTGLTTTRFDVVGGSAGELGLHDSNGNYSSWSSASYVLTTGTSSGYKVSMNELCETSAAIPSGGGGTTGRQGLHAIEAGAM